jgi:hypothetical protein
MKRDRKTRRRSEKGIALLIAIFVLLLISVVAIALLVSSGTETALGTNYRASSTVYYAALAGLEEARGRLVPNNPTYLNNTDSNFIQTPFPLFYTRYVINRLPGDNIVPWDPSNTYYDKEYQSEFNQAASSASWGSVPSVWDESPLGFPGPIYKWVRITAATEQSLYLDVDSDTLYDNSIPIYYDPAQVDSHGNPAPSLIKPLGPPPSTAVQVLQITALAELPNGSQKLLQYLVAPVSQSLSFPAALTLDGPNVPPASPGGPLTLPYSGSFLMDGTDTHFYSNSGGCVAGPNPNPQPVWAVGYAVNDANSYNNIFTAIHSNEGEYVGRPIGRPPADPSVSYVGGPATPSLAGNMQTLAEINALVTSISQQADVTIAGPATQSDSNNLMPAGMSATNPMTVVVNGDFTENGWSGTGYGILLVTGNFTYDQNSSWNGIILVLGKGNFIVQNTINNNGVINGAILIATTVDSSGNPLSALGSPVINYNAAGNQGIFYSSCWVQYVQSPGRYQVLSFHEIPQ